MYVNPVAAGVICTLLAEFVAVIIYSFWSNKRGKK